MNETVSKQHPHPTEEHYDQALYELYESYERNEPHFIPKRHGWRFNNAFDDLVELGEAKLVKLGRGGQPSTYRITLLGVLTHRRIIEDASQQPPLPSIESVNE